MGRFRFLNADEIECRVAQVSKNGSLMLLLYKDARVDQRILDETLGIFGWQREHQIIGNNLYCTVSVRNPETGEWIRKQDVGVESYTEKEKGQASDSFKRACFNLGIGRELYTAPTIWVNKDNYNESMNREGKTTTFDRFAVKSIGYAENGNITQLEIVNTNLNKTVFTFGKMEEKPLSKKDLNILINTWVSAGGTEENLLSFCKVQNKSDITPSMRDKCIKALRDKEDGK